MEEDQLDAEHLARIRVLVVPQASCLSDAYLRTLADWTRAGGRLIVTGEIGMLTEYAQERATNPFPGMLGHTREELAQAQAVGEGVAQWLPQGDANAEVAPGLVEAVRAMGGGEVAGVTSGGEGVDLVAWAQPDARRLLLHLDRHEPGEGGPMELRAATPDGWGPPRRVRLLDLQTGEREVEFACEDGSVTMTVDAPEWYAVVAVEY